jgi:hypothetical protein
MRRPAARRSSRPLALAAALAAFLPGAAAAQERPSLWDMVSLDRIVQGALQTGIQMLRTQMDLQYGDLSVDLLRGRMVLSDVEAWPFLEWDEAGLCEVRIDRLSLLGTPFDQLDRMTTSLRVAGLSVPPDCLPPDMRATLAASGRSEIRVPRLTLEVDYGMPKADALLRLFADVDGVATFDASADFSYLWFDGREDMDNPEPVMFLRAATLAVENRGLWDQLRPMIPAPFTGEAPGQTVQAMLSTALVKMNADADDSDIVLNAAQKAFVDSAAAAWEAFVAAPGALVLETAIEEDVYIDLPQFEDDPRAAFEILRPRVGLAPARLTGMLPAALLRRALEDPAASEAERRRAGAALVTGEGAPRNLQAGMALLRPLAEAGDGAAALMVARALALTDPAEAYRWALRAGAAEAGGAAALLDRLERDLPLARVLALQEEQADAGAGNVPETLAGLRGAAAARLSGQGAARDYALAAMWASLAAAAGDPEAAAMLEEIDALVRLSGEAGRAAWAAAEARHAELATRLWVERDLPARLTP